MPATISQSDQRHQDKLARRAESRKRHEARQAKRAERDDKLRSAYAKYKKEVSEIWNWWRNQ